MSTNNNNHGMEISQQERDHEFLCWKKEREEAARLEAEEYALAYFNLYWVELK